MAVTDGWARASIAGVPSAAYLTLTAAAPDRLVGVASPVATASLHEETMSASGIMHMAPLAGLDLPAGRPVRLAPGGRHIMLDGLRAPLAAGDTLTLTLRFAHAPPQTVSLPVRPLSAAPMQGMTMGH